MSMRGGPARPQVKGGVTSASFASSIEVSIICPDIEAGVHSSPMTSSIPVEGMEE